MIAQRFTDQCIFEHDGANQRSIPGIKCILRNNLLHIHEMTTLDMSGYNQHYILGLLFPEIYSHTNTLCARFKDKATN